MTNQSASLGIDSDDIARTCACAGDDESISVSQRAEQLASQWFSQPAYNDVEAFLARLPITIGGKPIDDPYAEWHPNTTDFGTMSRAHLMRIDHDWTHETALHGYLASDAFRIGIDTDGQAHIFSRIRATVTVLDDDTVVRTQSLADCRLSDWLTYIAETRGWDTTRVDDW